MSAIENFITGKSRSLIYWIQLFWGDLFKNEKKIDNSWKSIKLKSTYIPDCWDVNNPLGSVALEYNKQFETFKRYAE